MTNYTKATKDGYVNFVVFKHLGTEFSLVSSINHLFDGKEQKKKEKAKFWLKIKYETLFK